jgi:hypothetical protein
MTASAVLPPNNLPNIHQNVGYGRPCYASEALLDVPSHMRNTCRVPDPLVNLFPGSYSSWEEEDIKAMPAKQTYCMFILVVQTTLLYTFYVYPMQPSAGLPNLVSGNLETIEIMMK